MIVILDCYSNSKLVIGRQMYQSVILNQLVICNELISIIFFQFRPQDQFKTSLTAILELTYI